MPKGKPTHGPKLLCFTDRMFAVRLKRQDGSSFLACGAHGHPRLHLDRYDARKFRDELAQADCKGGRVVSVRVTIKELSR